MNKPSLFALVICLVTGPLAAQLIVCPEPVFILRGKDSCLCTPEGVAFSPDNQCMAIANAESDTITVYKRTVNGFETEPCTIVQNQRKIKFPHDLAFTPDGRYLGVVSRENHCVSLFRHCLDQPGILETTPCWSIEGKDASISYPCGLDFSSTNSTLMIVNRSGSHGVTFYRYLGEGKFETTPFHRISEADFLELDLAAPHGLGLMASGNRVGTVHKRFFKTPHSRGQPGLCIMDLQQGRDQIKVNPSFVQHCEGHLHSIAFHPSGLYFAVTHEGYTDPSLFARNSVEDDWQLVQKLRVEVADNGRCSNGIGPKGVAFSPDGSYLAFTVVGTKPAIVIYEVNPTQMHTVDQ